MTSAMSARWPGLMKRRTAAEYLDMSEAAFVREVFAGRMPGAFVVGGREHWSKDAIDAAIARLAGAAEPEIPEYRRKMLERYGKA